MAALGAYQTTLFAHGEPAVGADAAVQRIPLDEHCWVDLSRNWLEGADRLLEHLAAELEWRASRRLMYGRMVEDPRLHAGLTGPTVADPLLKELIGTMVEWLEPRYGAGISPNFANFYRDGRDSVAWHADRTGVGQVNPVVAICSLGGPRRFGLRPTGGGASIPLTIGSGDLIVMGGACQHRWEHCVPKMASAAPRMSLTFRHVDDGPSDKSWHRPA